MSDWFTSKLKAAENILQKIDQQAAESLGKTEVSRSDDLSIDAPSKSGSSVSLKDQLKKKTREDSKYGVESPRVSYDSGIGSSHGGNKDIVGVPKSSPVPRPSVSDGDWTELLGLPDKPASGPSNRTNGASAFNGVKNGNRQPGILGSSGSLTELKKNRKNSNNTAAKLNRMPSVREKKLNAKPSNVKEPTYSTSIEDPLDVNVQSLSNMEQHKLDKKDLEGSSPCKSEDELNANNGRKSISRGLTLEDASQSINKNGSLEKTSASGAVGAFCSESNLGHDGDSTGLKQGVGRGDTSNAVTKSPIDVTRNSSSGSEVDSESESGSSSDSESEREREERRRRRQKILAEKAAAKAAEAIRERENVVAKLEGEKQSLEKIIEDRAKQQVQEASELQTMMMETMDAVELEKQKHNNTRMEALQRLAKLETANADLAKSLASSQWNLEIEVKRVAELRQQNELKEVSHEELRRKIANTHQSGVSMKQLAVTKGAEVERELLEAEHTLVCDKIRRMQEKVKSLESNIEITRKEMEEPTEVEFELKRRLGQLTDHLIQKQAQVEALSSEKATLVFRIEAVTSMLDEGKSAMDMNDFSSVPLRDVESGTWEFSSKSRPSLEDKIRLGKEQLGSFLRQLDAIFLAGAVFLKRNPAAKLWAVIYLVCLHLWVAYILMAHTAPSNEARSGAVVSLENINNSSGA